MKYLLITLSILFTTSSMAQLDSIIYENTLDYTRSIRFYVKNTCNATSIDISIIKRDEFKEFGWGCCFYRSYEIIHSFDTLSEIEIPLPFVEDVNSYVFGLSYKGPSEEVICKEFYSTNAQGNSLLQYSMGSTEIPYELQGKWRDLTFGWPPPITFWGLEFLDTKTFPKNSEGAYKIEAFNGFQLVPTAVLSKLELTPLIWERFPGHDKVIDKRTFTKQLKVGSAVKFYYEHNLFKEAPLIHLTAHALKQINPIFHYSHHNIQNLNVMKQVDTLIRGAMFRKVTLKLNNEFIEESIHLGSNIENIIPHWYDNDTISAELNINGNQDIYNFVIPLHLITENTEVSLISSNNFPYTSAIKLPNKELEHQPKQVKIKTKFFKEIYNIGRLKIGDHVQPNSFEQLGDKWYNPLDFSYKRRTIEPLDVKYYYTALFPGESVTLTVFENDTHTLWSGVIITDDVKRKKVVHVHLPSGRKIQLKFLIE